MALHKGIFYIADAAVPGLQIIDLKKNSFRYFIPGGRGVLKLPINCFVDDENKLYVTDVERRQVVIYDEELKYLDAIGGDANFKPTDVWVTGDSILVTDPNNHRIVVYDRISHNPLGYFPEASEGDENYLFNPLNLWVTDSQIYITDFGESKIKRFTRKGEYIHELGGYGRNLGQFVRPKGIAVDREQLLMVVDAGFENIQIFNNKGQYLMYFGGPYSGPGDMYLPAEVIIDYDHLIYYEKFVDPSFNLKYLIFVTNQYGPDKVSVYGRVEQKF